MIIFDNYIFNVSISIVFYTTTIFLPNSTIIAQKNETPLLPKGTNFLVSICEFDVDLRGLSNKHFGRQYINDGYHAISMNFKGT